MEDRSLVQKLLDLQIALLQFDMLKNEEKSILAASLCDLDARIIRDLTASLPNQLANVARAPLTTLGID